MGEVVHFVPKSELERARLISEARAIYESIFPAAERTAGSQNVDSLGAAPSLKICITPTTHIVESIQGHRRGTSRMSVGSLAPF
jgi:hypothetical protein